jgi:UDP-GlcNAc3NAcA epimerase
MKVVSVVGARPQFIKAAVVSRALRAVEGLREVLVHTGQHYDDNMSRIFFEELEIPQPDYNLGIGGGTHGQNTGRMLEAVEAVLLKEKPDAVLVYGDTDSTLAGALAAVKLHIPVAHVEAGLKCPRFGFATWGAKVRAVEGLFWGPHRGESHGGALRSFNRRMPEEINRVLTDHASDILFAPTEMAVKNLLREGIPEERVHLVGDVMYDAALLYGEKAERHSDVLTRLGLSPKGYVLATIHRADNTDSPERLRVILEALAEVNRWVPVVFPVHPRTRERIKRFGLDSALEVLVVTDPVVYLDMIKLEKNAQLIVTDSGGVQKEAFFYRVPCVTLREETEWVELVSAGWNTLCPPLDKAQVTQTILESLGRVGVHLFAYGDGRAGSIIAAVLVGLYMDS